MKETDHKTSGSNQLPPSLLSKKGAVLYFESTTLKQHRFLIHAFCSRHKETTQGHLSPLSFSSREDENITSQNWGILARAFRIPAGQFLIVNQIHQDAILVIDDPEYVLPQSTPSGYDAIITNQPGIAIGIKTADCVPIFLVDKIKRVIGVVHAGWKGTALKIVGKAMETFVEKFGSQPTDIHAAVGPAIRSCCYEVDNKVIESIETKEKESPFHRSCPKEGKWMLDLPLVNKSQLLDTGVPDGNISMLGLCTFCRSDLFFSHRAEGANTGRQLNFMMLRK
jgi:YfiH family protein